MENERVKLIHSYPPNEEKFLRYFELTFQLENIENTFVHSLAEIDWSKADFDIAIVHYLRGEEVKFLLHQPPDIPKIWFFWGGDYFNQGKFYNDFLLPKTRRLRDYLEFKKSFRVGLKKFIKSIFPFTRGMTKDAKRYLKAINSFDYIVPVMPEDYDLMQKYDRVEPRLFHMNYVHPLIVKGDYQDITGKNILLGNSSSFANNHIEAIDQLCNYNLKNQKVIIPLSYGRDDLAEYISEYALNKLGDENIRILKEFLPFQEYNKIISSCEIVIMNHLRQQAVGNIIQALLQGSHIYLRSESSVYKFLKEKEFYISSLETANELKELRNEEVSINRKKTKEVFGADRQRRKLKVLIDKLIEA